MTFPREITFYCIIIWICSEGGPSSFNVHYSTWQHQLGDCRHRGWLNPLKCSGNYSATSNNMKLIHWPLMGELLHLVQQRDWAGSQPAQAVPNVTSVTQTQRILIRWMVLKKKRTSELWLQTTWNFQCTVLSNMLKQTGCSVFWSGQLSHEIQQPCWKCIRPLFDPT